MSYALYYSYKLLKIIRDEKEKGKWRIIIAFVWFFLIGYIGYFLNDNFSHMVDIADKELLIHVILAVGALFVVVVMNLSNTLLTSSEKRSATFKEKNDELLKITEELKKSQNELKNKDKELMEKEKEIQKANKDMKTMLEDFYTLRLTMENGNPDIKKENEKIKKKIKKIE